MSSINEYRCEYCNLTQSNKSNLDRHQRTSKKCIQIQETKGISINKIPTCKYCKKDYHAMRLIEHEAICILKPPPNPVQPSIDSNLTISGNNNSTNNHIGPDNSINTNLTVNNNITNNIVLDFGKFFTDEKVAEIFQEYKSEHALEQMKGLAKFIIEKMLLLEDSPGYFVKDAMRNIYAYETETGIKTDKNGEFLRAKIKDGAGDHINGLVDQLINQYGTMTGKKNENKVEEMKDFKKEIGDLNTTPSLVNCIKKSYTCKNKEERKERVNIIKESKIKDKAKKEEALRLKKLEEERKNKIKMYKFNIDRDRPDTVLSKGRENEPLDYSDKIKLEELGLKYTEFFLEDLIA